MITVNGYRNQVLRILQNYRQAIFRIDSVNRCLALWYMGNAQEIQLTADPFVDTDELTRFSRDFLSVQSRGSVFE